MMSTTTAVSEVDEVSMLEEYQTLRLLRQGGFGTVHEILCEDGQVSCRPCSSASQLTFSLLKTYALKTVQHGTTSKRRTMAKLEG
jgi:hypothetical protein